MWKLLWKSKNEQSGNDIFSVVDVCQVHTCTSLKKPDISVRHRRASKMATVGGKLFYTSNSKRFVIRVPTANFQRYWKNSHGLKQELWVPVPPAAWPTHSAAARATHGTSPSSVIKQQQQKKDSCIAPTVHQPRIFHGFHCEEETLFLKPVFRGL